MKYYSEMDKQKHTLGIKLLKKSERLIQHVSLKRIIQKQMKKSRNDPLVDEIIPLYNWVLLSHIFYYLHNKKIFRKHYKKYTFYKELKRYSVLNDDTDIKQLKQYFNMNILKSLFIHFKKRKTENYKKAKDKNTNIDTDILESKKTITELLNNHVNFIKKIGENLSIHRKSINRYCDTRSYSCLSFENEQASRWGHYCKNENICTSLYEFLIK